jgi:Mce-associated membrane protein
MSQAVELEEQTEEPRAARRGRVGLVVVLVLLAAAVVLAGVQWRRGNDRDDRVRELEHQAATRREIATTAGEFGQALLTYDYNDLNSARTRVLDLATDHFAQEYTSAFTGGLDTVITKLQATSNASVRDVYVGDDVGDTAHAVVTLDSEVKSTAGTRRTVGSYLDLTLVHQDGRWKVDIVISVAALEQQTIGPDGNVVPSSTTTTSAPVPSPGG